MVASVAGCGLVLWDLLGGFGKSHLRQPASLLRLSLSDCPIVSQKCRCLSRPVQCIHYTEGSHVPGIIPGRHVDVHPFKLLYSDFTYTVVKTHLTTGTMGNWLLRLNIHMLY